MEAALHQLTDFRSAERVIEGSYPDGALHRLRGEASERTRTGANEARCVAIQFHKTRGADRVSGENRSGPLP